MTTDDNEIDGSREVNITDLHSSTYNLFILVLTIFSLLIMVLLLLPWLSLPTKRTLLFIDTLICFIFLGDFFINLARAPNNRNYFFKQGGWLELLGSIPAIPGLPWTALLRLARLGRLIIFLRAKDQKELWRARQGLFLSRGDGQSGAERAAGMGTAFVAIVVMSITSVVVLQVETMSAEANIMTGGDAFWWAFVTVTTVGYGDHYPVTGMGRLMAMILMVVGVGIFGVLTSYFSSTFLGTADTEAETYMETVQLEADMVHLKKEMAAIKEMLQELTE